MRRFTLLFALLLSLIGVVQAQTVITDLNNLSNDKLYVLSSGTGTLQVTDDAEGLRAVATADNENTAQHFAILKSTFNTYHLYSVSAQKFVSAGTLVAEYASWSALSSAAITFIDHAPDGTASGKFMMKNGSNYYNIDGAQNLFVNSYNTHDNGNGFSFTEVGDLENSVDVVNKLNSTIQYTTDASAPKYYSIQNIRGGKFASGALSSGSRLSLTTTLQPEGFFYFTEATPANGLPEGAKAVYIHNVSTTQKLAGHTQNPWGDTGVVYYLIPAAQVNTSNTSGYVITNSLSDFGEGSSWNNFQNENTQVDSWNADDVGSVWWLEFQTADDLSANLTSALNELKTSAIAEAEAEGARPYYACSEENVNACLATINAQQASTYDEYATAKANIADALSTLRTTERIKPLQGGETIILENRNNLGNYLSTNAADATGETEAVEASELRWYTMQDVKSLWTVVAIGDGTFKLCNALSGKYVQHQANDVTLKLTSQTEATAYEFTNQDLHYILIGASDSDTKRYYKYINHRNSNLISNWWDSDGYGNHWQVLVPSEELLNELSTLQTPIADLKVAAAAEINQKTLEGINAGVEFYTISEDAFNACKEEALDLIEAATTHAELEVAKVQALQLFDNLWTATDNRTNELTAGVKVKFRNKAVSANYMTTDAGGATTSSEVSTASVWELVANDAATGFYLYNPLSHTYIKHAAGNGQQAALVADKAEATLYSVKPSGAYVLIGETVENDYNEDYLHADEAANFVTRWLATHDRSLWTVTSATTDEATQLNTEIQNNIATQLTEAVAAAEAVYAPYAALEFYKPTTAVDAYKAAIAVAQEGVDTYEELAAALEAIAAAQAAFEAAVAADDVQLANPVEAGSKIKLLNRKHTGYYMSSTDGKVSMKNTADASSIWTLKAADEGGYYLYNDLTNTYVKHSDYNNSVFTLVASTEDATVYYVHPKGLYVTVGRLAEQSTADDSREYLHGVDWDGDNSEWVVRWNAVGEASHWTLASVTDAEKEALNQAISAEVMAQWEAYKAEAQATVDAYKALPYFTATDAAVAAYGEAVAEIGEVVTYFGLANAKTKLDEALATFLAADRSASNLVQDGDQIRLVNKHESTFYMTTDANGVDAYAPNEEAYYVSSTIWTAIGNSTDGYKLFNPLKNGYIVHPTGNGVQATLVTDAAQATLYNIVPNGLYVNITLKEVGEEARPCLHFGTENHVTKYTAADDRSLWGITKATDAEKTQLTEDIVTYVQTTITAAKEEALVKANAADDFAYYACTAENVATAVAALNAVSTDITTHEALTTELAKIEAAMTALYESERAAGPAAGDLIRFTNKVYVDHYLGYDNEGLAHYVPAETEEDGALASTTIWELEAVEGDNTKFYLKNYLVGLYTEHQYNSGWQVQFSRTQSGAHPVTITMVEHEYNERGELCFVIKTTEEVNGQAIHAASNGVAVNGSPSADASMWAVTRATDEDLDAVNLSEQLKAIVHFLLEPTIEAAKRYYYEEADGTVTNDFMDDVKAGYYTYDVEDANWDDVKSTYVSDINRCIALAEGYEGSNRDQVLGAVQHLEDWMANFKLNLPNKSGFFRVRCVYNNQYLQSDLQGSRLALNENTGTASLFYFEAEENVDGGGRLLSYDQGLYMTQGKNDAGGIYAGLQPMGTNGDAFSFSIPANNTFGSYNISSKSGSNRHVRFLYGNAYTTTQEDTVTVKHYYADNGADATVATQGDTNNNGYNWVMERADTIPVTVSALGWATFYAPIALGIPDGVKAYICTGMDSNYDLTLVELSDVIPAGTAVLLEGAAGTYLFIDKEFEASAEVQSTENNCLRGVLAKTWRDPSRQNLNPEMTSETGYNKDLDHPAESGKVYTLGQMDGKVAMFRYAGNQFRHFCSYLDLSAEGTAGLDVLRFGEIVEPTAIEEAPVVSLESAIIYDLSGRRVAEPGKGVYIVNGKKVYFK